MRTLTKIIAMTLAVLMLAAMTVVTCGAVRSHMRSSLKRKRNGNRGESGSGRESKILPRA